jgi:hypothetical protein
VRQEGKIRQYALLDVLHAELGDMRRVRVLVV